jgi:hypothetical protein
LVSSADSLWAETVNVIFPWLIFLVSLKLEVHD